MASTPPSPDEHEHDPLASHTGAVPLDAQVGGHPGVLTSEDGSLLIKPALPAEVAFYTAAAADPGCAPLRPFLPKFYGTLRLEGSVDASAPSPADGAPLRVVPDAPAGAAKDESSYLLLCVLRTRAGARGEKAETGARVYSPSCSRTSRTHSRSQISSISSSAPCSTTTARARRSARAWRRPRARRRRSRRACVSPASRCAPDPCPALLPLGPESVLPPLSSCSPHVHARRCTTWRRTSPS